MQIMKISNNTNYNYSKNSTPQKTSFKGYFACPLKAIYIKPFPEPKFILMFKELQNKCGKYFNIALDLKESVEADLSKIKLQRDGIVWGSSHPTWLQDYCLIMQKTVAVFTQSGSRFIPESLADKIGLPKIIVKPNIEGGNCFLGVKRSGKKFALVGEDVLDKKMIFSSVRYNRKDIAFSLGVEKNNLHIIPQPNFHLDMAIRPLVYPYVLVGDPDLTLELARKTYASDAKKMQKIAQIEKAVVQKTDPQYASAKNTVSALERQGFKPIRVPGLLNDAFRALNFMNAIVHQLPDGRLIYITNKSSLRGAEGINFETIFKEYLKEHVPEVKKIVFISGNGFTQEKLRSQQGGIHCMSLEHPDFKQWSRLGFK